ncbi:MAG: hypothetical protein IT428_18765 [Planctomycetaceae bacterium]|nr:hypothetical protein [Planctomycetaceae bacterium]
MFIRLRLPSFKAKLDGGKLTAVGSLQPSPLCETYTVCVQYRIGQPPAVEVVSPELRRRGDEPIPHMYLEKRLCLYVPWERDWTPNKELAKTIIPWSSLWLYYYELWHATGEWLGGGHQPGENETIYTEAADERAARQAVSHSPPGWGRDPGGFLRRVPC